MKLDVKALGKAIMFTGGLMTLAFGVALLVKLFGSGFLMAFNVVVS